jgi:capsular polysaccharide transport system permease protein
MQLPGLTREPAVVRPAAPAPASGHADVALLGHRHVLTMLTRRSLVAAPLVARQERLSLRAASFVALVLMPVAIAATYYFAVAADQYVAVFRFTLDTAEMARPDPLSLFAGNAGGSPAALESQVLVQYINSRAIVDRIDRSLDLRRMFSPSDADWWARLPPSAPIEEIVRYWHGQVDPFFDPADRTVTVRVRAFTPMDALRLSDTIVTASESLVNELSRRARQDAVQQSEKELAHTEARLKTVLADIRAFRDREGIIDPGKTAEATVALATELREQLLRANTHLATLRSYMRDGAPPMRALEARIRALEAQRRSLAHEMTGEGTARQDTLTRVLGGYEQLESERKFAETAYQHALRDLDQARANADRQRVFVASFVPPSLPEEALYPRRWRSLGTIALLAFALWGIGGLALQSIRDHLV